MPRIPRRLPFLPTSNLWLSHSICVQPYPIKYTLKLNFCRQAFLLDLNNIVTTSSLLPHGLHKILDGLGNNHICPFECCKIYIIQVINQHLQIGLVMTDFCMSGMSGYDLLKRVKVIIIYSETFPKFILFFLTSITCMHITL